MKAVNIKAYSLGEKILVKYFDNGCSEELCCPSCGWLGNNTDCNKEPSLEYLKLSCPECFMELAYLAVKEDSKEKIAA